MVKSALTTQTKMTILRLSVKCVMTYATTGTALMRVSAMASFTVPLAGYIIGRGHIHTFHLTRFAIELWIVYHLMNMGRTKCNVVLVRGFLAVLVGIFSN